MPYGVRLRMIGSGPTWLRGVKIFVWSLTPSRAGIITSLTSNRSAGFGACSTRAGTAVTSRHPTTRTSVAGRAYRFIAKDYNERATETQRHGGLNVLGHKEQSSLCLRASVACP